MIAYRLTDRLADISTNVSKEAVDAFEQQGAVRPGRMVAIHNGIDIGHFLYSDQARSNVRGELGLDITTPLLLAVGRICEQKDYLTLLHAFSRLAGGRDRPHLAIVGDGPLLSDLQKLAGSLGITDQVRFLGIRHDVASLMSACDLFVLSSAWEGFGLVVAEAMACKRPVVATDCGGVREVVGDAGFLVPPKDADALAQAMQKGLELNAEERDRLGARARERVVSRYSFDVMAERYLSVYKGVH
jgi:glycosyltransferase involved in cell wall biosynthesis